mmetsp:Transcript_38177/g.117947  ORF Transcript_38177/g.117947 Transcript_38177/m.117947 type:complete len:269 (+) Transcript_38177:49-855(+)
MCPARFLVVVHTSCAAHATVGAPAVDTGLPMACSWRSKSATRCRNRCSSCRCMSTSRCASCCAVCAVTPRRCISSVRFSRRSSLISLISPRLSCMTLDTSPRCATWSSDTFRLRLSTVRARNSVCVPNSAFSSPASGAVRLPPRAMTWSWKTFSMPCLSCDGSCTSCASSPMSVLTRPRYVSKSFKRLSSSLISPCWCLIFFLSSRMFARRVRLFLWNCSSSLSFAWIFSFSRAICICRGSICDLSCRILWSSTNLCFSSSWFFFLSS